MSDRPHECAGRGAPPDPDRRRQIAKRFAAAEEYDAHSQVQQEAADALAASLRRQALPPRPSVLEIGCGTGHLSERLAAWLPGGRFLFTDLAWPMLARCRARLGPNAAVAHFAAMDGEAPAARPESFDLIVSSMTFQWFDDLGSALARLAALLRPRGALGFVMPGAETFREWREAHAALGLDCGTLPFPDAEQLRRACEGCLPGGVTGRVTIAEQRVITRHPDARTFLRGLRAIGATVPRAGHEPLPYTSLRAVMRRLDREAGGVGMTYHLLFATLRKE